MSNENKVANENELTHAEVLELTFKVIAAMKPRTSNEYQKTLQETLAALNKLRKFL